MLHGVQLISKPNISQNGLIYLARLHTFHPQVGFRAGMVVYGKAGRLEGRLKRS